MSNTYAKEFIRFDTLSKGFIAIDLRANPRIVYCNEAFARLLNDRVSRLFDMPIDDITLARQPFTDYLTCYRAEQVEFCNPNDGSPVVFIAADGRRVALLLTQLQLIPCSQGNAWAMYAARASALTIARQWASEGSQSNPELAALCKVAWSNRKSIAAFCALLTTASKKDALSELASRLVGIFF
jgi:hypothetical protein